MIKFIQVQIVPGYFLFKSRINILFEAHCRGEKHFKCNVFILRKTHILWAEMLNWMRHNQCQSKTAHYNKLIWIKYGPFAIIARSVAPGLHRNYRVRTCAAFPSAAHYCAYQYVQ